MKERQGNTRGVLFLAALVCAVSCSRGGAPALAAPAAPPAAAPEPAQAARPTAAPPAAPPAASVIASETHADDPVLRCDLLEVRRVSGGAVRIKWRMVNTGAKNADYSGVSWSNLYFVDPAENKKYGFLTDTEGHGILDVYEGTLRGPLKPGQQVAQWAKFPAPPATSTKVTVNIPKFAPFEDVPVSQ